MSTPYAAPVFMSNAFNCPFCNAYAMQTWEKLTDAQAKDIGNIRASRCERCRQVALWHKERLFHPDSHGVAPPNSDLPEDVQADYLEATSVFRNSPRSAAALLRLAIQKLCVSLGETGDINEAIGNLVKKGLDPRLQQSLDIVRVVGNNAVHPGHMDLRDDYETVSALFGLVNLIAQLMITQPKEIARLYNELPLGALKAIAKRDETP